MADGPVAAIPHARSRHLQTVFLAHPRGPRCNEISHLRKRLGGALAGQGADRALDVVALAKNGFVVDEDRDAPDRPGRELVFIAPRWAHGSADPGRALMAGVPGDERRRGRG